MGTPEYWRAMRDREISSYRSALDLGLDVWLEISPGPDCLMAAGVAGYRFNDNELPVLPLRGCAREYGCACCYQVRVPSSAPASAEEAARVNAEYEAALAKLPKHEAEAIRSGINSILKGFGMPPDG